VCISAPEVTYASYRNLTQRFGSTYKISKEYSAEKFNSKFSTWWFQTMPEYYDDQILRANASVKLKIHFSTPTEMSHHNYLYRRTAKKPLMIITNKEKGVKGGGVKSPLTPFPLCLHALNFVETCWETIPKIKYLLYPVLRMFSGSYPARNG
jgi:hypothetical protein